MAEEQRPGAPELDDVAIVAEALAREGLEVDRDVLATLVSAYRARRADLTQLEHWLRRTNDQTTIGSELETA